MNKKGLMRGRRAFLLPLALMLSLLTSACGEAAISVPEEIDMGSHGGHGHEDGGAPAANQVSCTDLKAEPSGGPVKSFELTAAETKVKLGNGKTAEAWTYNGSTPGPELRVTEGDRIVVHLKNKDIDRGVAIHWHGVILPCSQDGVPGVTQNALKPGESFTYEFVAGDPGTYWYHSHQQSSMQVRKGLLGRLIVEPKNSDYAYDRDYAVTLQKLNDRHKLTNGTAGGLKLEAKPGETVRLRLINSFELVQWMGVAGADFKVISMDARDLNGPGDLRGEWVGIGGGQRYDLLITMPESGKVKVYSRNEESWSVTLGEGADPPSLDKKAKTFDFTSYGTPHEDGITADMPFDRTYELELGPIDINNERGHHSPPMIVSEGEWIKVRITHKLGSEHPMHLHGHVYKVLTKNGKPLTGSPIYADSLMLFKGEEYEIAFQADNPGLWMLHCHNLSHATAGMTMMVNYDHVTTPYRVGTKSGNLPD